MSPEKKGGVNPITDEGCKEPSIMTKTQGVILNSQDLLSSGSSAVLLGCPDPWVCTFKASAWVSHVSPTLPGSVRVIFHIHCLITSLPAPLISRDSPLSSTPNMVLPPGPFTWPPAPGSLLPQLLNTPAEFASSKAPGCVLISTPHRQGTSR